MRAINASIMRQENSKLILNQIRLRPISRAELSEVTGLTRASVTQIVEELIGEGIVVETTMIGRTRLGRRSTQLAIAAAAGAVFGVNLSRVQCSVGLISLRGDVLAQNAEIVAGRAPEEVLDAVAALILRQKRELELENGRVYGVGLCVPGPVDAERGRILDPINLEAWHGLDVARQLGQRVGFPVYLQSAANAQALAEKYFGAAEDSFALLNVDDSISMGAIVRGELYRGAEGLVAELGRCMLIGDGAHTLDQIASLPALLKDLPYRTWQELMEHCEAPDAKATIERLLQVLAPCVSGLIHVLCVGRVVLSGDLTQRAEVLLSRLNAAVRARTRLTLPADPVVACACADPVRIGAAPAFDTFFAAN